MFPFRAQSLVVRLFFFTKNSGYEQDWLRMSTLLSVWYGLDHFTLEEVCYPLRAEGSINWSQLHTEVKSQMPNCTDNFVEELERDLEKRRGTYNKSLQDSLGSLALLSGSRSPLDGTRACNDASFRGVLRRYLRAHFHHFVTSMIPISELIRQSASSRNPRIVRRPSTCFEYVMKPADLLISNRTMKADASVLHDTHSNIKGMMSSLENLGHGTVDFVEGLKVELLEFQKQSVKWALERESIKGGVQSLLWTKLPRDQGRNKDVYFCPISGMVQDQAPSVIRGGLIAAEMGLGKTVISLALILKNPAPVVPTSGSASNVLAGRPGQGARHTYGWDRSARTLDGKTGRILSRGTLVIVSLASLVMEIIFDPSLSQPLLLSVLFPWLVNGLQKPDRS